MAKFNVPASPARNVLKIEAFKGVDLTSSPVNVEAFRSPYAPNMIRDVPGKVRKRQGYKHVMDYDGRINGVFLYTDPESGYTMEVVHAGSRLYFWGTVIYEGMADERSQAKQFFGKLFIFDGKKALVFGRYTEEDYRIDENPFEVYAVKPLEDEAYVPTVIVSRKPTGGGTTLEPLNLIGRRWTESFLSDGTSKVYQLTTDQLDADAVTVRIMTNEGEWEDRKEGTDFTVDRENGTVTFATAPGESPIEGYDNVEITAAKTREGYADKINKCSIMTLYGVNGASDRIFVSGNPDFPNQDWYCKLGDGFFWGDLWYSTLGQENSAIMGYVVINDRLGVVKGDAEEGRNVILRKGEIEGETGEAAFPIIGTLSGRGAVAKHSFGYMGNEPLFLTDRGVMAITAADITGEKYSQSRSYYIDGALTEAGPLWDTFCFVWRDFYILSRGDGTVYLLDGLQKSYEKETPYSNFQYECYFFENIPARVFWADKNDKLCFGDENGGTWRFMDDPLDQESYHDAGKAIPARWDTPELSGKLFYKNKNFRRIDVMLAPAVATGVTIYSKVKGIWSKIFDSGVSAQYLDFDFIDFGAFSFSTDDTPRTLGGKIKIKKVDKVAFSFRNEEMFEPFGLFRFAAEYTEGSNYKG